MRIFKSFLMRFTKKGLLYYGIVFLAFNVALNGAFSANWSFTDMLVGISFGLISLLIYDLALFMGERKNHAYLLVYSILLFVEAVTELLLSTPIYSSPSFIPVGMEGMLKAPVFGLGLESVRFSGGCVFLRIAMSCGSLGTLALLVHLKHLLEITIRRFSPRRLFLISLCLLILFCPLGSLNFLSSLSLITIYCVSAGIAEVELEKARHKRINNLKPLTDGRKPRVVFPLIEAGKGHITPAKAICEVFKDKYGDRVEVVESKFYSETGNEKLVKIEKLFASAVQMQNRNRVLSWLCRLGNFIAGDVFAQYVLMAMTISGVQSKKPAAEHLQELDADLIFTTHWSTPFYINHIMYKDLPHPYTIMFCPDVYSNGMFNMDCNSFMMPMKTGHDKISRFRMYAGGNTRVVPFPLRREVYKYEGKRDELRALHGIDRDAFVVTLCDGGYGMANLEDTVKELLKSKEKMTLIALCGTNEKLYQKMCQVNAPENIDLRPMPFTDKVLELLALSDLFVGKSGANSMAEPAFFGVPIIVTRCATYIERHIKDYYVHHLKGAMYIPSPKLAARKIVELAKEPEKLDKYKKGLQAFRANCDSEAIADMIYEDLVKLGYEVKEEVIT